MDDCLPPKVEYGTLRKSAFGRTNLFLTTTNAIFKEIRCSASSTTRQASASIFHTHGGNNSHTKPKDCVCWHCCHPYEAEGFRIPRLFDPSESVYHVYGWYCSANCAKAYILEHSTFDRGYQMNIFVRMLRDVYGIDRQINEAPPRLSLKMFGGPFDIENFRTEKNICLTVTPPFVSYCMLVEERQPIGNIGEEDKTLLRCSVRGLKRPSELPNAVQSEDICAPNLEGLYRTFLDKQNAEGAASSSAESQPPPKRTRVAKKPATGGLAKFACNKE